MKIGLYGGTFDPPHLGHMEAAASVIEQMGLDQLIFMPTAIPPHKNPSETDSLHRLAMTQIAADVVNRRSPNCKVRCSDHEVRAGERSYTYQTIFWLKEKYPEDELYLLMGDDMFFSLEQWRHPELFLPQLHLCVFHRGAVGADMQAQLAKLSAQYGASGTLLTLSKTVEISSSSLRDTFDRAYLHEQVYGYILNHGLYGVEKDLRNLSGDDLRAASYSCIYAKRVPHVRGMEETAVWLAEKYGADVQKARRAAILHDITKYKTHEEQLKLVEKYGIVLDKATLETKKLLHAKTGAAIAAEIYGEGKEVCTAISYHTTGRAGMTLLEKVIYLADYIEPNRDFDGVEELREAASRDLDEALILGLTMSIEEVSEKGAEVYVDTLQALQALKEGHS